VPRSIEGAILSIGDKADTIAGMFSLGLVPSGSKDPFALRRQANAIVKVIAEKKLPFRLSELMRDARAGYQGSEAEKRFVDDSKFTESVHLFFRERLEFYLKDVRGYSYDIVNAVLAVGNDDIVQIERRARAVSEARASEDFRSVCIAFKRISNILSQALANAPLEIWVPREELYSEAEKVLVDHMRPVMTKFSRLASRGDYADALVELSKLRPFIDDFFNKVMVMADDKDLRRNRLAILETLENGFSLIADFSEMVAEGVK
jgi:glycyl-tRNA synthetase beta chain